MMSEASATADLVGLTRLFYEVMDREWDFDALAGFFAPDAVWDLSASQHEARAAAERLARERR